jgi:hypothetical protein
MDALPRQRSSSALRDAPLGRPVVNLATIAPMYATLAPSCPFEGIVFRKSVSAKYTQHQNESCRLETQNVSFAWLDWSAKRKAEQTV